MPRRPLVLLALLCGGCVGPGLFSDGSSVSVGTFNAGRLRRGRALPPRGEGYIVPALWVTRDARYGTDEVVAAIQRVARRVRREYPGGLLGVADLAVKGGGESKLHRSHENGRDADLIFYAVDESGRPVPPANVMPCYDARLCSLAPHRTEGVQFSDFSNRRFDVARNWALVRALLQDPAIDVQYLFCNEELKRHLLDHARRIRDDPDVIEQASELLHQPGDSLPHDDHLHLRIFCAADDRALGCVDRGPERWWKKRYKYMAPERGNHYAELLERLRATTFLATRSFVP